MFPVWCVCQQDYGKTTGSIFMKLGGRVQRRPRKNPSNFGVDSKHEAANLFFTFVNIVRWGIWSWQRSALSCFSGGCLVRDPSCVSALSARVFSSPCRWWAGSAGRCWAAGSPGLMSSQAYKAGLFSLSHSLSQLSELPRGPLLVWLLCFVFSFSMQHLHTWLLHSPWLSHMLLIRSHLFSLFCK